MGSLSTHSRGNEISFSFLLSMNMVFALTLREKLIGSNLLKKKIEGEKKRDGGTENEEDYLGLRT